MVAVVTHADGEKMKTLANRESKVPNPDSKRRKRLRFQGAFFVCALVASVIVTSGTQVGALPAPPNTFVSASVVDGVPTPDSPLSDSDCALVIQMTGTIASGLGVYEILEPATATPERTYSASEAVQFVVLPGGCDRSSTSTRPTPHLHGTPRPGPVAWYSWVAQRSI